MPKGRRLLLIAAVLLLGGIGVFSSQVYTAALTATAEPLQNATSDGSIRQEGIWSAATEITRHESADLTINGSDVVTDVAVQGTKTSGAVDVLVELLDASATVVDNVTISLPTASGPYNSTVTALTAQTVGYHTVARVRATYASAAGGPVAVDGAVSTKQTADPPFSWSHTVGTGANRLLVVAIGTADKGHDPTGVTFGAAAMTAAQITSTNSLKAASSIWYLINPASGTDTITVSYSQSPPGFVGGAVTFKNVDQTTPVSGAIGATGNAQAPSVNVTSATDDMVVAALGVVEKTATTTGTPTQTVHWSILESGGKGYGTFTTQAGQTSVTSSFSVTGGGSGFDWAISAMNIKNAP